MELKKSHLNHTEYHLLQLLNEEQEEDILDSYTGENDIVDFISVYKIKEGKNRVKSSVLYDLYKNWAYEPKKKKQFSTQFNKYFHCENNTYNISIDNLSIAVEKLKLLNKQHRNRLKSPIYKTHFDKFVKTFKIFRGKIYIESYIFYFLYDKWVYDNKLKQQLGYNNFIKFMKFNFDSKRIVQSKMNYFGVSNTFIRKIGKTQLEKIRQGYKNSKENKTISKQVSSIRSFIES